MQLLNSNISQGARTTRYGNKKAQDLQNLVFFCYVAFSYYKDGKPAQNRYIFYFEEQILTIAKF